MPVKHSKEELRQTLMIPRKWPGDERGGKVWAPRVIQMSVCRSDVWRRGVNKFIFRKGSPEREQFKYNLCIMIKNYTTPGRRY
jgi:hypothetical protein